MKKNILQKLTYLLLFISVFSFGQNTDSNGRRIFGRNVKSINPSTGVIKCGSSEYEEYLQETVKGRATTEEFEAWLAPKVEQVKKRMLEGRVQTQLSRFQLWFTLFIAVKLLEQHGTFPMQESYLKLQY